MSRFKIKSADGEVSRRDAQTYGRRLLKLANYLESIPANQYQHKHWYSTGEGQLRNGHCGTSACALGWAAASGLFRSAGLTLREILSGDIKVPTIVEAARYSDEYFASGAADHVFGPFAFESIFSSEAYDNKDDKQVTRRDAVTRIRSFVRQRYGWALA